MSGSAPRISYLCLQTTREGQASHAHVHEIIAGLVRSGWDVRLFQPYREEKAGRSGAVYRLLGFLLAQWRLWRAGRPDLVYARFHFAAWPTVRLARRKGIPVVLEVNGPYLDLFLSWPATRVFSRFFRGLMRDELRSAAHLIAVTESLAEWLSHETGSRRISVIPNAANTGLFTPAARVAAGQVHERPYVVFFGAFSSWQGIGVMLQAAADPAWPPDLDLVFIGDGVEATKVVAAQAENVHVRYVGIQPYRNMPRWIASSVMSLSVQVNDARSSTGLSPLKVFESLSCGVPVIVSDYPGMADLVRQSGCGMVIPPHDPGALARAVSALWRDPARRAEMGRRGRSLVETEHSWERRAADTNAVLRSVLYSAMTTRGSGR